MKRFTLKRVALSLVTAIMLLSSQGVMAKYVKLTALKGQNAWSGAGESCESLVDANKLTKWGTWFQPQPLNSYDDERIAFVVLKAEEAVVPEKYFLVTGNEAQSNPNTNWKSWKIYGGNFESDAQAVRDVENYAGWTLIEDCPMGLLPAEKNSPKTFTFSKTDKVTSYKYFWIEILDAVGYPEQDNDVYMQMAEWGLGTYSDFEDYCNQQNNQTTGTDEPVKYNILDGTKISGGESLIMLFDGKADTKWGNTLNNREEGQTENGAFFIVRTSRPMAPTYYALTTANDTQAYSGRNWKQWQIYGMNADSDSEVTRESDKWVPLDKKYGVGPSQLPAANFTQVFFDLSEKNPTEYKYFKLELDQIVTSGDYMQMAEFALGDQYTCILDANAIADAAEEKYDPEAFGPKALYDDMAAYLATVRTCSDVTAIAGIKATVDNKLAAISVAESNYAELLNTRNRSIKDIEGGKLKESAVGYLNSWVDEVNAIAPNDEFPCGNIAYIKANRQLSSEEAYDESTRISAYLINNAAVVDKPITASYTFLSGTSNSENWGDSPIENLIDGDKGDSENKGTKWGTGTKEDRYIIFKSDSIIKPTYYGLVTGWDTKSYPTRNWKNWKIWGANFASDEEATKDAEGWVLIDNKENVGTDILKTANCYESYIYLSEGCTEPYKYFKIEVYHDGQMQMNEFTFYNQGNFNSYRKQFIEEFEGGEFVLDDYKPCYQGYVDAYNKKYQNFLNAVTAPDLMKLKNELVELQDTIEKSYEYYYSLVEDYKPMIEGLTVQSESLSAWAQGYTTENVGPGEKYIRGTIDYIVENGSLNNDAIQVELKYLERIVNTVENELPYILLDGHTVGEWGDGFYGNLIDGVAENKTETQTDPDTGEEKEVEVKATKWGGKPDENGDTYIIFRTYDKIAPFFYSLTTGNDTGSYPGRNWGTWYIYGANFEGDGGATKDSEGWVLIDKKENVGQDRLRPVNAEPSYFGFTEDLGEGYTYYKVVVTKAYSGNAIQMNEMAFGTFEDFEDLKDEFQKKADAFETDLVANQELLDNYDKLVPSIDNCETMEDLFQVNYQLEELQKAINASVKTYSDFAAKVEAVQEYLDNNPLTESESLATLKSYINNEVEVEPNNVFVHGSAKYITENHVIADSVVLEEVKFLESLKAAAVTAGYVPGTDITAMIVNPTFAEAEAAVDADGKTISGKKQAKGWDGYLYANGTNEAGTMSAAEFCNGASTFNISQTLTGLKNGYYEVKLNAGFRPHNDINSFDFTAMAFANDTKTYVPVVREGMTDKENAWLGNIADKVIYAIDVNGPKNDPKVDSVEVGYVIWGVQGTINAILQNRYEISMVAKVTDGKLTFGLKNDGTIPGSDWLGAGNFRLTYLGEEATAEAIEAAAACNGDRAATIEERYQAADVVGSDALYKANPNFAAAQKESLKEVANSTTVDQLIADGNLFADITATKAAYYNLYFYKTAVVAKWGNHPSYSAVNDYVKVINTNLTDGAYADVDAVNATLDELLAKYPDYLEISEVASISDEQYGEDETEDFNYAFSIPEEGPQIYVTFSTMYDDLKSDETLLEFEYTSDKALEGVSIASAQSGKESELGTLEATSEFKKVTVNVKDFRFAKSTDDVVLSLKANGAKFNIRRMMFVTNPGITGDLTGDQKVNIADVTALLTIIANQGTVDQYPDADLTGDNKINIADLTAVLTIIANQSATE